MEINEEETESWDICPLKGRAAGKKRRKGTNLVNY
jgi:hypothetical protein